MYHPAHRGQAPAKGILHLPERRKAELRITPDGKQETVLDPRGYWLGQHTAPEQKRQHRKLKRIFGARQHRKHAKNERRVAGELRKINFAFELFA